MRPVVGVPHNTGYRHSDSENTSKLIVLLPRDPNTPLLQHTLLWYQSFGMKEMCGIN